MYKFKSKSCSSQIMLRRRKWKYFDFGPTFMRLQEVTTKESEWGEIEGRLLYSVGTGNTRVKYRLLLPVYFTNSHSLEESTVQDTKLAPWGFLLPFRSVPPVHRALADAVSLTPASWQLIGHRATPMPTIYSFPAHFHFTHTILKIVSYSVTLYFPQCHRYRQQSRSR